MTELMNELIPEVFVEQPLALPGSDNYSLIYLKKTEYNSRKFNTFQKKKHNIFTVPIFGQKKPRTLGKNLIKTTHSLHDHWSFGCIYPRAHTRE